MLGHLRSQLHVQALVHVPGHVTFRLVGIRWTSDAIRTELYELSTLRAAMAAIAALYVKYECTRCTHADRECINEALCIDRSDVRNLSATHIRQSSLCMQCGGHFDILRGAVTHGFPLEPFWHGERQWWPMHFQLRGETVPDLDRNGLLRVLAATQEKVACLVKVPGTRHAAKAPGARGHNKIPLPPPPARYAP